MIEDLDHAVGIVARIMGRRHGYYASSSSRIGARGLVALVNGDPAGSVVFYRVNTSTSIGVIYYVAVDPRYRGRGIGKILVLSAEEEMNADLYVATLVSSNKASFRMFKSLCYTPYTWEELEKMGNIVAEVIYRSTCSYEDDLVMIKGVIEYSKLGEEDLRKALKIWEESCYKPWLMQRY